MYVFLSLVFLLCQLWVSPTQLTVRPFRPVGSEITGRHTNRLKHLCVNGGQDEANKIRCQSPLESLDSHCLRGTDARCKALKSGELRGVLSHGHISQVIPLRLWEVPSLEKLC